MRIPMGITIAGLALALGLSIPSPAVSAVEGAQPERLSEHLYVVHDACNVYIIKHGRHALLIDSGEGAVLPLLAGLGVDSVDWVLQTHAHRDQCGGTPALAGRGAKVAVPAGDAPYFSDIESFWDKFELYIRYSYKPDSYKPRFNIHVDRALADGESLEWNGITFRCLATPGHTVGGGTYLATIDGRRVAFSGDMIYGPGKVWNLYGFDHKYWDGGLIGVQQDLAGLNRVLGEKVEEFLPSHGAPIDQPGPAVDSLKSNMSRLYDFEPEPQPPASSGGRRGPFKRWNRESEHLYHVLYTSFVLLSADSSALFYDYYATDSKTSYEYFDSIVPLLRDLGVKHVDLVIPSHFHEDHVRGIPDLVKRYGTKVWVYENMVDILEHPDRYNLPCLAPEHIVVDRVLHDNETIQWKEYTFTICHFPGQTMYHQGMYGVVDGKKVFFTGDTDFYPVGDPSIIHNNQKLRGISTFLNYYLLEPGQGYLKAAQRMIDFNPEVRFCAHSGGKPCNMEMLQANLKALSARRDLVAAVLPPGDPNIGFDPNRVHFYPYSLGINPDTEFETAVVVRNYLPEAITAQVSLATPDGWRVEPPVSELRVEGKMERQVSFRVMPGGAPAGHSRTVITARVTSGGENWGEPAEMLLDWKK